jgi:hypothetical protein
MGELLEGTTHFAKATNQHLVSKGFKAPQHDSEQGQGASMIVSLTGQTYDAESIKKSIEGFNVSSLA